MSGTIMDFDEIRANLEESFSGGEVNVVWDDEGKVVSVSKVRQLKAFGCLHEYANPDLIPYERDAWAKAAVKKYVDSRR